MDSLTQTQIRCPHCQAPSDAKPVTVIPEGTSDVDSLFDGTLNLVDCAECGKSFLVETPILYRDDAARYMIYFLPGTMVPQLDVALGHMARLYHEIFDELDDEDRPDGRLAVKRGQFIEKISIHQFGYDDRIIEYVKYMLYQHNKGLDHVRHELLFDFGNSDDDNIMFVAFDREQGKPAYTLGFEVNDYRELEEAMFNAPDMQEELESAFREYYVSVDDLLQ